MARARWHLPAALVFLLAFSLSCFWAAGSARAADYSTPTTPFTNPAPTLTAPSFTGGLAANAECPSQNEGTTTRSESYLYWSHLSLKQICREVDEGNRDISKRLWWVTAELLKVKEKLDTLHADQVAAAEQRSTTNSLLTSIREKLEGPLRIEPTSGKTLAVHETEPAAFSTPVASSVDASGEAIKGALWYLIGISAFGLVGYAIYRQVMPRA